MGTIHKIPADYRLSAIAESLALGVRAHSRSEHANEDLNDQEYTAAMRDRARLALWALVGVEPVTEMIVTYENGDTIVDHTQFTRAYQFLHACGFSDETINDLGISPEYPFGIL